MPPPLRYRDNTARQKRERGIEATVNGGKFRQNKVQHGENDQGGHCQNNGGIAQRLFHANRNLPLRFLLTGQFKAAFGQFAGQFSGADHRLVERRKYLRPGD